jgi:hypothetical protein
VSEKHSQRFYADMMRHDVPRPPRRPTVWQNFGTKAPRRECCGKEPPACTCEDPR